MVKNIIKSTGAILAGFISAAILSILTDLVLEKSGAMNMKSFDANSSWIIVLAIGYRAVYNTAGCYLTARLAPGRPMLHAMIIGIAGFIITLIGAIIMRDKPPHWYPIILIVLSIPCAWLGARIFISFKRRVG